MKEEEKILKRIGKENPFRVPDGYFDTLTSEVMSRLPEKAPLESLHREPTRWERIRPWLYMAAMFVGAALIIRVASSDHAPASSSVMAEEATDSEMEYINMAVDGAMMDDYSLYVYLADADAE